MFFGSGLIRLWCLKVGPLGSNWVGLRWDGRAPQSSHDDAIKEGVEGGHTSGSVCLLVTTWSSSPMASLQQVPHLWGCPVLNFEPLNSKPNKLFAS